VPTPTDPESLNITLLEQLRRAAGQFVPLFDLGIDRARVWSDLAALEQFGFQIERHPFLGAAYRGPAERLCPDQIEHGLNTQRIGRRIAVWNRLGSTNDIAARAATNIANDGLVVLAEEQTSGRGQRGRLWMAPARSSILLSALLFPPAELTPLGLEAPGGSAWLTALAAVATAELVTAWSGRDARIKWPNDVRIEHRKIAGILIERGLAQGSRAQMTAEHPGQRPRGVVIGIGLNVNMNAESFPAELSPVATSLSIAAGGGPIDRSDLARDLIRRLDAWYGRVLDYGPEVLNNPWRARSEHLGNLVRITTRDQTLHGRLIDLDLLRGLTLAPDGATKANAVRKLVTLGDILALEPTDRQDAAVAWSPH
jgi:BirA family biotin operon repressor/biotin-[acetyl-CoA-carboxylase] ligase